MCPSLASHLHGIRHLGQNASQPQSQLGACHLPLAYTTGMVSAGCISSCHALVHSRRLGRLGASHQGTKQRCQGIFLSLHMKAA